MLTHWRLIDHADSAHSDRDGRKPAPDEPLSPAPLNKPEETFAPHGQFSTEQLLNRVYGRSAIRASQTGKRQKSQNSRLDGQAIGYTSSNNVPTDIAIAASLRASGLRRLGRQVITPLEAVSDSPRISKEDLRFRLRSAKKGTLILFVVDSSGSMGARKRMGLVKGAILDLLSDAYRKRDRVGLVVFRGERADVLVPPTNSVELAEQKLRQLPTGGKTPLGEGLYLAAQVLESQVRRTPNLMPLLVLITDGRGNSGAPPLDAAKELLKNEYAILVLDSEQGYVRMGDARRLAETLNASYATLDEISHLFG